MNGSQAKSFPNSEEAVEQGKKDLLEILRLNPEIKLGLDAAQVEKSRPDPALSVVEIDFQKLLETGDVDGLDKIAGAGRGNTTPLSVDNQVIGLIETRKDADGWRVSAIGDHGMKNDLNEIRKANQGAGKLNYFEVPNINARIYTVSVDGKERYLTGYNGFSLQRPMGIADLLPKLKQDAIEFQRVYGEKLKNQKLVR